jgi:hypothetical protein
MCRSLFGQLLGLMLALIAVWSCFGYWLAWPAIN